MCPRTLDSGRWKLLLLCRILGGGRKIPFGAIGFFGVGMIANTQVLCLEKFGKNEILSTK